MAKGEKKTSDRSSTWTSVFYPESAPDNWRDIIAEMQMQIAVSPLHDRDVNPDGTLKKAHYHVAMNFSSLKTYQQACEVVEPLKGSVPQRIKSIKGTVRYMTHMDNPEKAQYPRSDISAFGGFDLDSMFTPTVSERYQVLADIIEFIDNNDVIEFCDLVKYAASKQRDTWFPILADSAAYFIGQYIKSARHKLRKSDDEYQQNA